MQAVYFTAVAILLYLFSDWLLNRFEVRAGKRFEHRSLIFLGIIMALAVPVFAAIRYFTGAA